MPTTAVKTPRAPRTPAVKGTATAAPAPAKAKPKARAVPAPAAAAPAPVAAAAGAGKKAKPEKAPKAAAKAESKPPKVRPRLVRDGFTMPEADFSLIGTLKARALSSAHPAKKSELLRAGLHALAAMDTPTLVKALKKLEPVKTGRPGKAG